MTRLTYREAVRQGMREALAADDRVLLIGEDVGRYGGAYACSKGLLDEFGPERVRDAPLSEAAFAGAGIGAALAGLLPIVEIMTVNFSLLALDQIVNNAATLRHMSGGQMGVPLVIRMATGAGRQVAAQHSHSLEVWYAHVPGLKVLAPATVTDARWMLAAALADPDPVVICEHALLYPVEDDVAGRPAEFDAWHAAIRRSGCDATLVTSGQPQPAPPSSPPAWPETGEERAVPTTVPAARATAPPTSRPIPIYGPGLAAGGRPKISPAARRRARELAVDPAGVSGTGRGGAITLADVERAAEQPRPAAGAAIAPPAAPVVPLAAIPPPTERLERMRRTIAAAMARSKREIPHYYLATTIDLGRAMGWLAERNAAVPVAERLLPGVLLLKAAALAIHEVPELNAVWDGDRVVLRETVHVGVAIALRGGGLVILALHDTATRPLAELMVGLRDLTGRARAGRMKSSELADATLTVTSLGDRGVEAVYGVIYPPQVAIVGFGRIVDRPWAVSGGLVVRPVVTATLAADHRVSDGHRGGLFLDAVDRLLQEPEKL